jgi:hypothetical protein
MLKANLGSNSVPRVELDRRARDARLRLERLETTVDAAHCRDQFVAQAGHSSF